DPNSTGKQTMFFFRSKFDPATGTDHNNPRQQVNEITSFIDGSQVYGSDGVRASDLRTHVGGKLLTSAGNLLPFNTFGLPNQNQGPFPNDQLFVAGDVRSNENIQLTAIQTLFMREHNRLADQIAATQFAGRDLSDPTIDEAIYQQARQIVGA